MGSSKDKARRKQERDDSFGLRNEKEIAQERQRQKQTRTASIVLIAFAVVAVIVLALNSNMFYRNITAVRTDGHNFSITEMGFYQRQGMSFDDAAEQAATSAALHARAVAAGLTLNEEQRADVEENMRFFLEDYGQFEFTTASGFITANFGSGMNARILRERIEFEALASAYAQAFLEETRDGYSEAELEAHYLESADMFDRVEYRRYVMNVLPEGIEEGFEELEHFVTAEVAEAVIEAVTETVEEDGEQGFVDALQTFAAEDDTTDIDWFTRRSETLETVEEFAYGQWLLNPARIAGDFTVIEEESGTYLVYFIGIEDNRYYTANVRHILITPGQDAENDAETIAEELLARYIAAGRSEEYFIELVREYSADYNGEEEPGLYRDLNRQTPFVAPFLDWSMDESRRPGDVEIVETIHGFHILLFDGHNTEMTFRHMLAANTMLQDVHEAWMTEITENLNWTATFFARLVG